jgi:hypothetical protein
VFGVLTLGKEQEGKDLAGQARFDPKDANAVRDSGRNFATIANVCFGLGAVAIAAGGFFFYLDGGFDPAEEEDDSVTTWTPWVTPDGGVGFGIAGSF